MNAVSGSQEHSEHLVGESVGKHGVENGSFLESFRERLAGLAISLHAPDTVHHVAESHTRKRCISISGRIWSTQSCDMGEKLIREGQLGQHLLTMSRVYLGHIIKPIPLCQQAHLGQEWR